MDTRPMTLTQKIPLSGAVIVTTPQEVAQVLVTFDTYHLHAITYRGQNIISLATQNGGSWKGTVKQDPFTVTVQRYENDGLIYSVVGAFEVKAHFDGKPYPMTGPLMASGSTAAFKKTGPRSFESKQVQPGQPVVTVTVSASPDGKSLTAVGVYGSVKHVWALDRER